MSDTAANSMSKPAEVQRFEVFTGAGRRRRWPAEVKARIGGGSERGGGAISAVARRHGLLVQQLFAWRRQARDGVLARPTDGATGFVPVEIEPRRATGGGAAIEVVVGEAVIRVPAGVDPGTLLTVLRALRQRP